MKSIINPGRIEELGKKMSSFFEGAEAIARQTKFVQRESGFSGKVFLKTLVFGFLKKQTASLKNLAQQSQRLGVKITPQGIDDRINQNSVAFVKAMFLEAFEQFRNKLVALPVDILQQFTAIYLLDSTFKQLPAGMSDLYPGSGGKASSASLKVQLVFEFLYGNLVQLSVEAGRAADQAYLKHLEIIQAGSIIIADLGYFRLASLHTVAEKQAYFLTRYHYPTSLFHPDGVKLDLLLWLRGVKQSVVEIPVVVGASPKSQVACRLTATAVPAGVAEERRRKANRNAATHGKTLSADYLDFLGWSLYLTNTPDTMLSSAQVIQFYRIRWQIELVFKFWKSYCGLEATPATRSERILTEFYAKLLMAVLVNFIIAPIRCPDEALPNREISLFQLRNILATFAQQIACALPSPDTLRTTLDELFLDIQNFGFKQLRRKNPNICAMLASMSLPNSAS